MTTTTESVAAEKLLTAEVDGAIEGQEQPTELVQGTLIRDDIPALPDVLEELQVAV
ncbi:MAG: hypothetical protein IT427_03470 [Pirellulales bacterium]|nr:hypothetical protein [Pirellulales bacterium]